MNPGGSGRSFNRASVPHLGGSSSVSRPQFSGGNFSRPSSVSRPTSVSRPSSASRPNFSSGGGFRPSGSSRPNTSRPQVKDNPNLAHFGNRPTTLPGTTRPSLPHLGGGSGGNFPNIGGNRPGGGSRPNSPNIAGNRPTAGGLGNFLGMDRPITPGNRTGIVNQPNVGNRANIGNRNNVNINRPINLRNVNAGNRVINNRPNWANINNNRLAGINNRWQSQVGGLRNWNTRFPARTAYWHGWANGVRSRWGNYNRFGWFNNAWWRRHYHPFAGWHYSYAFNRYPWTYWWSVPTFVGLTNWFAWSAPAGVWTQPIYYDYGPGGNVVYQDNSVYINGQPVATADEFAQSAAALATVPPPPDQAAAEKAEWMPLGTFGISANEKDVSPTRVIQLAVDKQGVISGTLYNTETDESQTVQGQVDKDTQRVALRFGDSQDIVAETGLYNLTQDEAPLLVHFGKEKVENWLLVRLKQPENQTPQDSGTPPNPPPAPM